MKRSLVFIFLLSLFAPAKADTLNIAPDDPMIAMIDSLLKLEHVKRDLFTYEEELENKYGYPSGHVPEISDSVIQERIAFMNRRTPFEFEYNEDVLKYIRLFVEHRRTFTAICMGRAPMYFPMFEEKLDKYGMPLEIRHLSVVESALNPTAKSWAGAMGLWQFMVTTGKMYGLEVDSYVDERRDPLKATEAACQYLSMLHRMYNDWSMALAAYNAGPGTVNRAIRRSGGKMTYWEIREFLPKETQGYVPTFIAVNYVMTYAAEHNIIPRIPERKYYEVDTVHFHKPLDFNHLSLALGLPADLLKELNPIYKTEHIPWREDHTYLYLPTNKIGVFMANEDSLYSWNAKGTDESHIAYTQEVYHTVQRGEYLSGIAYQYHCTVDEIKMWNGLSNNNLYPGQKLRIRKPAYKPVERTETTTTASSTTSNSSGTNTSSSSGDYYYYTIQNGDTLWDIAQKKGISLQTLRNLNPGLNSRNLKVGQRLRVGKK